MTKLSTIISEFQNRTDFGRAEAFLLLGVNPIQLAIYRAGCMCNFGIYEKIYSIFIK
jgi:hypothetical protein